MIKLLYNWFVVYAKNNLSFIDYSLLAHRMTSWILLNKENQTPKREPHCQVKVFSGYSGVLIRQKAYLEQ